MVKVIMGLKGSGKTKQLVDLINTAAGTEHGNVVAIERSAKLKMCIRDRYDIAKTVYIFLGETNENNSKTMPLYFDTCYSLGDSNYTVPYKNPQ